MRALIGAALQEAALDPFLTGREHMRFQGALHGLSKDRRERRGTELIARVGLSEAADRKVGTYSGGMRRRLDLALALVHEPRILFLDEPTTGLDPQSRNALWEEVERLARRDGVTVFLTTQYLEEADRLADRVGIIDHGRIVAEGTPEELKATIAEPSVEAVPAREEDRDAGGGGAPAVRRAGRLSKPHEDGVAVRLGRGADRAMTQVIRALDTEGIEVAHLQMHAPSLDDVFLEKTGRSLEGSGDDEEDDPTGARRARAGVNSGFASRSGALAGRAVVRTARQPAQVVPALVFPLLLLAINASGLDTATQLPGLPDRLLPHVRAGGPVHPGRPVLDHERRHRPRAGHRDRLPEPPVAHSAARCRADHGAAGRGGHPGLRAGRDLPQCRIDRRRRLRGRAGPVCRCSWH